MDGGAVYPEHPMKYSVFEKSDFEKLKIFPGSLIYYTSKKKPQLGFYIAKTVKGLQ